MAEKLLGHPEAAVARGAHDLGPVTLRVHGRDSILPSCGKGSFTWPGRGAAGGEAGRELCTRGGDQEHRRRVARCAATLRGLGVQVLTLGSVDDAVVTAADAVVPPAGEPIDRYVLSPRPPPGADWRTRSLGHG